MKFNPPFIKNIEEVLPYIKDNKAFIVVDKGFYKVIDYVYNSRDTFIDDYTRECRGLKFDSKTGNIIARPYHKFHNLGECAGYFTSDVDLTQPHNVLDKLDGSMVHTCIHDETIFFMTRMGQSEQALSAERFVRDHPKWHHYRDMILRERTKTFIFEYVGPNNRIVIPYEKEELIMTAIRDIYTGEYTTMALMSAKAAYYDIPCVDTYGDVGGSTIDNFYDFAVKTDEVKEGCVVRFDTGAMVKMKSEIYVRKHKSKELTETNKGIIQVIVDQTIDDIIPQLEPAIADAVLTYQDKFVYRLQLMHEGLRHILSLTKHMEQKEFALHIQATYPKITQQLLFATRKLGDGREVILTTIKKRYNKEAELVELMTEMDFPLWL